MATSSEQVFSLSHPFEFRGASYIEFKARRPKVRDLRNYIKAIEKDSIAAMAADSLRIMLRPEARMFPLVMDRRKIMAFGRLIRLAKGNF